MQKFGALGCSIQSYLCENEGVDTLACTFHSCLQALPSRKSAGLNTKFLNIIMFIDSYHILSERVRFAASMAETPTPVSPESAKTMVGKVELSNKILRFTGLQVEDPCAPVCLTSFQNMASNKLEKHVPDIRVQVFRLSCHQGYRLLSCSSVPTMLHS